MVNSGKKSILIKDAPLFALFWENSKFGRQDKLLLANMLAEDARTVSATPQLFYPTEDLKLEEHNSDLLRVMGKRESMRTFSPKPLSESELAALFSVFRQNHESYRRLLPSAGAKYPVEVFSMLFNVDSSLNGKTVYYNHDNHSLSVVTGCGAWDDVKRDCGLIVDGTPAVLFIFVGFAERVAKKYGERGGRFFLIEVGHYAQNLALAISDLNLAGVEAGGLYDDAIKERLQLSETGALIGLGLACGKK
jgi:SagB-type dehydrogenase family enzyme